MDQYLQSWQGQDDTKWNGLDDEPTCCLSSPMLEVWRNIVCYVLIYSPNKPMNNELLIELKQFHVSAGKIWLICMTCLVNMRLITSTVLMRTSSQRLRSGSVFSSYGSSHRHIQFLLPCCDFRRKIWLIIVYISCISRTIIKRVHHVLISSSHPHHAVWSIKEQSLHG